MTKGQEIMSWEQRIRLKEKLKYKVSIAQIAQELGFSRQTIYNEIERGRYLHTYDHWDEWRYSAEKGQGRRPILYAILSPSEADRAKKWGLRTVRRPPRFSANQNYL